MFIPYFNNDQAQTEYNYMKENLKLRKQLTELQKENDFLKIEKRITINGKMKSKPLSRKSITLIMALMAAEPYTHILSVKDTISSD